MRDLRDLIEKVVRGVELTPERKEVFDFIMSSTDKELLDIIPKEEWDDLCVSLKAKF